MSNALITKQLATVIALLIGLSLIPACSSGPEISRLNVLVTGNILGYIKNCGCSTGQFGGLVRVARRVREDSQALTRLKPMDKGLPAPVVLVDLGNFANYNSEVTRIESAGALRGMATMDYASVGIGSAELLFPQDKLLALLDDTNLPLTVANLEFITPPEGEDKSSELNQRFEKFQLVEAAPGYIVGVIHVVDYQAEEIIGKLNGFRVTSIEQALREVLNLHLEEADLWLLTVADGAGTGSPGPSEAGQFSELTMVIGYEGSNPVQTASSTEVAYPVFVFPNYRQARDVVQVEAHFPEDGRRPAIMPTRLAVPDTLKLDEQVNDIIVDQQPELEALLNRWAEEQLNDVHPFYTGRDACVSCHAEIGEQLESSEHYLAYNTLVDKHQENSAACVPCHIVGNKAFPDAEWSGGWNAIENPVEMQGVHCENCHGPGEYHIALMTGKMTVEEAEGEGRDEFGLQEPGKNRCLECHDPLNSPHFEFKSYWEKIEH